MSDPTTLNDSDPTTLWEEPQTTTTVLRVQPRTGFVETPYVKELTERALSYVRAGFPLHLRGPAGSGKTTLAVHISSRLGRPIMLLCGDDEFTTSDLVGKETGYSRRYVRDNYIHSVLKVEEDSTQRWTNNRLTQACQEGYALIYDEFTRSRPEANNILLSVLEEKLLVVPSASAENGYIKVHPHFSIIFTSNPEEYIAIHKAQDALLDRMITIEMSDFDYETEVAITAARPGICREDAERIVNLMRAFRETGEYEQRPSIRKALMIAKILCTTQARSSIADPLFRQTCLDVLDAGREDSHATPAKLQRRKTLLALMEKYCPNGNKGNAAHQTIEMSQSKESNYAHA